MTILENFKILQEVKKFDSLLNDLGFKEKKLTSEQLSNFYFENVEKVYEFLPITTFEFLKKYYENNNTFVDDGDDNLSYECLYSLKELGIIPLSKAEIDYEQALISLDGAEMELETACIFEDKIADEPFSKEMDLDFVKVLFSYLEKNQELIQKEFTLRDTISGILHSHLAFEFNDLCLILNELNFEIDILKLDKFLKYKIGNGVYFTTSIENENVIAEKNLKHLPNLIPNLLELKECRVLHSLDVYKNLNFHFYPPQELLNIEEQLDKLDLESDRAYLVVPFLQNFMLTKKPSEEYLNLLEEKLDIPVTTDLLIKENVTVLLNRWPNAFEGGKINSQRVVI